MKSAHRHELETNVLAHRLEVYIEQLRPHLPLIIGAVVVVLAAVFAWSYFSGSIAARDSGAWDEYNLAIGKVPPNLDELRRAAEGHSGTTMQQLADVTWADGQVYSAAQKYIYNREAAMKELGLAESTYQGILSSADDPKLINRARIGLARVYEMQNDVDKAREQYKMVDGGYAEFAKQQAERLAKPETKETIAWLVTAKPILPKQPGGPGTPGQQPEFNPGDLPLGGGDANTAAPGQGDPNAAFQDVLKGLQEQPVGEGGTTTPPAAGEGNPIVPPENAPPENAPAETPEAEAPAKEEPVAPATTPEQPASEAPVK